MVGSQQSVQDRDKLYPETMPLNRTSSRANAGVGAEINTAAKQARRSGMRSQGRGEDARFIKFLRSAWNDVIFSRIIFFIIREFSRACGFSEIRRTAYECSCDAHCSSACFKRISSPNDAV